MEVDRTFTTFNSSIHVSMLMLHIIIKNKNKRNKEEKISYFT